MNVIELKDAILRGVFANVIIKIKGDCRLSGTLNLGPGCILDFEGGTLRPVSNGVEAVIVGYATEIRAPKYQIFNGIKLRGTFSNSTLPVEWFGAIGNGFDGDEAEDNSYAIQNALDFTENLTNRIPVELGCATYNIGHTIVLNKLNQSIVGNGCLQILTDIPVIEMRNLYQKVDIREIRYRDYGNTFESMVGTGVLLSGNVHNATINVDKMIGLKVGFDFTPSVYNAENYIVGLQYNKVSWQYLECETGINLKVNNFDVDSQALWVNENQFNGGRLYCKYGIVIEGKEGDNDKINGNVFNCIGFEGWASGLMMETPIKVKSARLNNFHDLRMSEGIVQTTLTNQNGDIIGFESTYIDLEDCEFMDFSIKSILPFNFVKSIRCNNISIRASVSDKGMGSRYKGRDTIFINQTNPNNGADLSGPIHYSVSSNIVPQNYYQKFEFRKSLIINFDMLFVRDVQGQVVMSNIVELEFKTPEYVDDNKTITIDFSNSSYRLHPEMIICFRGIVGSKLKFINSAEANQSITNNTLTRHGTYKVTFNRDENVIIVPLAYFD